MHLKRLHLSAFKRFTDLTITGLNSSTRLIVLAGPNGSGKSSFFDALKAWHWNNGANSGSYEPSYHQKIGLPLPDGGWTQGLKIELHEDITKLSVEDRKKLVYVRSAHRNEAEFVLNGLNHLPSPLDSPRIQRSIDNDVSVSQNYQRLILSTLGAVYDESLAEAMPRAEIRDKFIGTVRDALKVIFPDLTLLGVSSDPLTGGTFYFQKGASKNFPYKNLSAGEKAAFDLLLDMALTGQTYNKTIWCIDEPETHLNVRVQATLLDQLLKLLPDGCQLVLASHSLGFMRRAWELAQQDPADVQFIDFKDRDFDTTVSITPTKPTRDFWNSTLDVAMGDLAVLLAPECVVLCEGRPVAGSGHTSRSEFDAKCYRAIFSAEYPNADFISVGNSDDVRNDKLELGKSIQTIVSGTKLIRITDRDLLSEDEVSALKATGVQVLSRRNIESYLLDDEILTAFATANVGTNKVQDLLDEKKRLHGLAVQNGKDQDDLKSICGDWYVFARRELGLKQPGSTWEAFAVKHLAPMVTPGTQAYTELKADIFSTA